MNQNLEITNKKLKALRELKLNTKNRTMKDRFIELMKIVGRHPDAISLLKNMALLDEDMIESLINNGVNGYGITEALIKNIEVRTGNSTEIMLYVYGEVKPLTPDELNKFIHVVQARLEQQRLNCEVDEFVTESQQLALDELEI